MWIKGSLAELVTKIATGAAPDRCYVKATGAGLCLGLNGADLVVQEEYRWPKKFNIRLTLQTSRLAACSVPNAILRSQSVIDAAHAWPQSCPMCAATWHRDRQVEKAKHFIALLRELRQESKSPVRMRLFLHVVED